MSNQQSRLGDWSDDDSLEKSVTIRRSKVALRESPEGAEPNDDLSCPWCLAPKSEFKIREMSDIDVDAESGRQVSCGNCSAVIPIESDWYLNGVKMCFQ